MNGFPYAAEAVWILAQCFLTWCMAKAVAEERFRHGITVSVWSAGSFLMASLRIYHLCLGRLVADSGLPVIFSVGMFILTVILFKIKPVPAFQCSMIAWNLSRLWDCLVQTILFIVLEIGCPDPRLFQKLNNQRGILLLIYALLSVPVGLWIVRNMKKLFAWTWLFRWPGAVLSVLFWFVLSFLQRIYYFPKDLVHEEYFFVWQMLLLGAILLSVTMWLFRRRWKIQEENRLQKQRIDFMEKRYQQLLDQYQDRRQLVHDVKNQYLLLKHLLETGESSKAAKLIEIILPKEETDGVYQWSGQEILDMILSEKAAAAKEAGIECRFFCDDLRDLTMSDVDICSLFGNLLDNAIEAQADRSGLCEKWIELNIRKKLETLFVSVSNPYEGSIQLQDGFPVSKKKNSKDHGYGTRLIERVVNRYDGSLRIQTDHSVYCVTIIMNAFSSGGKKNFTE